MSWPKAKPIFWFGDETRSRLHELFEDRDFKNAYNARYNNKSFADFQRIIIEHTPYCRSIKLQINENDDVDLSTTLGTPPSQSTTTSASSSQSPATAATNESSSSRSISFFEEAKKKLHDVTNKVLKLKKNRKKSVVCNFICVRNMEGVRYCPSKITKRDEELILTPPSLHLVVPECEPNSRQRLNTGYIIEIPHRAKQHRVEDKKIMVNEKIVNEQPSFVIFPQFICKDEGILPSLIVVDERDNNLFFVNVYNKFGRRADLSIYFHAVEVKAGISSTLKLIRQTVGTSPSDSCEVSHGPIIKRKDYRDSRCNVYNLKTKVLFHESAVDERDAMRLLCPTFICPRGPQAKDSLLIDRQSILFTSRRREWCDGRLFTAPGYFSSNGDCFIAPYVHVAKGWVFRGNTHCIVSIDTRLPLYSDDGTLNYSNVILSGAYADLHHDQFKELREGLKEISRELRAIRSSSWQCDRLKRENPSYENKNLMLLADYRVDLREDTIFNNLVEVVGDQNTPLSEYERNLYDSRGLSRTDFVTKSCKLYNWFRSVYDILYVKNCFNIADIKRKFVDDKDDDMDNIVPKKKCKNQNNKSYT